MYLFIKIHYVKVIPPEEETALRSIRAPGFALVAVAAAIWGSDAIFRRGLALELPASVVVFLEHAILVVLTLPFAIKAVRRKPAFRSRDVIALLLVGMGSSALATVLFTRAFVYGSPTTPLLLQKMQPLFAVMGARLLLGERFMPKYALFFSLGVGAAYLITFPDPLTVAVDSAIGASLAVGAAALWAMGTVLGKHLSLLLSFVELTALRFALGLAASGIIVTFDGEIATLGAVNRTEWTVLLLLALIPGLIALLVYYRGLRTTPASAATMAELAFPLSAILINNIVFNDVLSTTQWLGAIVLSATILVMTGLASRSTRSLGVISKPDETRGLQPRVVET